jgi:DHA1 family multidrug resistance protein-like MFS transporter
MNKKAVRLIFVMAITTMINNMAHPVTPELVNSIGYGSFLLGALFASMSLANFLMSPVWGKLTDKYGRKPFMVMAPIGYGLTQLGFGFSTNPYIIVMFRLLAGGISCASFVAGMAYLIDVTDANKRTNVIALYTAVTGFTSTLGYLVGGFIGDYDYHRTFLFQGIISVLSSFLVIILIKESYQKITIVTKNSLFKDLAKYRNTYVPFLLLITMMTSFLAIGFNNGFNSYMKFVMNLGPKKIGFVMAITGIIGIIMNIGIFPLIKRKFNDFYSLILSIFLIFLTLTFATYFETINFSITLVFLVIFFAFLALYKPLLQSIISKSGTANGEIMGLNNAFNSLGNVGGSFYTGAMFAFSVSFTFYSLALIGFLTYFLLITKRNKFKGLG